MEDNYGKALKEMKKESEEKPVEFGDEGFKKIREEMKKPQNYSPAALKKMKEMKENK